MIQLHKPDALAKGSLASFAGASGLCRRITHGHIALQAKSSCRGILLRDWMCAHSTVAVTPGSGWNADLPAALDAVHADLWKDRRAEQLAFDLLAV